MPRKKLTPFKSYEGLHGKNNHVRVTEYMLKHKSYIALPAPAKELYLYLRLWARGRDTVKFAASLASTFGMDSKTFRRARDNLIEYGFIEYLNPHTAKDKKQIGVYQFSHRWYTGKTPELQPFEE